MSLTVGRPDAIMLPSSMRRLAKGPRQIHRIDAILKVAEPLLGVVRGRGERGFIHPHHEIARDGSQYLFVTRSPLDTIMYRTGHPSAGRPRYRWSDDGMIRIGYLLDDSEKCVHEYDTFHVG